MLLLDEIVAVDAETITSAVTIRATSPFFDGDGVAAWVGLEYMAQTVAALAGHQAVDAGERARPGFLLGTRHYRCNRPAFPAGVTLRVTVRNEAESDAGLAGFHCTIAGGGIEAEASLVVFQPDNVEAFLAGAAQ
jgi:predicted hotdog family 3-hydroxylacyl-ACP dehydratase